MDTTIIDVCSLFIMSLVGCGGVAAVLTDGKRKGAWSILTINLFLILVAQWSFA